VMLCARAGKAEKSIVIDTIMYKNDEVTSIRMI
jgi:hypothetical protein